MHWDVVYKSVYREDGSLLFPERLSQEFLDNARRQMGSYYFANQYLNEVIPDDAKVFKKEWLRIYDSVPDGGYNFCFIDPAIGQHKHHDYTGIAVVTVVPNGDWYVRVASRYRLTPTGIINKIFEINDQFKPMAIGIEIVAYQEALLYILDEKMRQRKVVLPIKDVRRQGVSKQTRILGLVPRFEWGRMFVARGMKDFEDEYFTWPRGKFDDILDSLCSIENILVYPEEKKNEIERPNSPNDPNYEKWYIRHLSTRTDGND